MRIAGKTTAFIVVLTVLFVFIGCDNKKDAESSGGSSDKGGIELRVSWWGSESRHSATLEAIELYEERNPLVKIIPEYQGWDGYQNKLKAQIMAGNAPDVFSCISEWYGELIAADGLADISGMIDVSGHNPKYVDACSYDGKMYGVNLSVNAKTLIQNRTLLQEYSISPLEEPYSWDEMAGKFKEVYDKSGGKVYGISDYSVNADGMGFPLLQDYGYTALAKKTAYPYDNEKFIFTANDIRQYFRYFADLRKVNGVAPPEQSAINDLSANSLLVKRVTAFEINWAGSFYNYQDQMKNDLIMAPLPVGSNGETGDVARPGIIFSVFKKTKHQQEAAKFIDFFTNDPEVALILKTSRGVLPTESQRTALMESDALSSTDKKVMAIMNQIMKREFKDSYSGPAGNRELQSILPQIGQKIAFNKIGINDAVDEFMHEVGKLVQ
ncbi:extracellular solute-binding protein [Marispirochaeta sp.]|uniref:ABC transporter substrate-binding protein n=1 Tax=Marispirochaeta sp. TaxID=2038653 RepID=UPI0029C8EE30|nr:extracellular solute-binding protein [Marispirochaeta sp.]